MTSQQSQPGPRYWPVPVARAVPALAAAAIITFSQEHSARLGLVTFGTFAIVTGLVIGVLGASRMPRGTARSLTIGQGVMGLAVGVLAVILNTSGIGVFLYVVSVWAALTGFLELYAGFRVRPANAGSRDWLMLGSFTALLALVFLLIPPDPVLGVGLLGAYAVILGVYLVIAGLSLKWTTNTVEARRSQVSAEPEDAETQNVDTQDADTKNEIVK